MLNNKSLNKLNQILDTKVLEFSNEELKLWLQNNWMKHKDKLMVYVDKHAPLNDVVFEKRLTRYMNYFSVLEKETNEEKRNEYIFNYLTEIPVQLYNYVSNK